MRKDAISTLEKQCNRFRPIQIDTRSSMGDVEDVIFIDYQSRCRLNSELSDSTCLYESSDSSYQISSDSEGDVRESALATRTSHQAPVRCPSPIQGIPPESSSEALSTEDQCPATFSCEIEEDARVFTCSSPKTKTTSRFQKYDYKRMTHYSRPRKAKDGKLQRKCPIPGCNASVMRICRHLAQVHFIQQSDIPEVLQDAAMQCPKMPVKRRRPIMVCPVPGCSWAKQRLDRHLQSNNGHNISHKSLEYVNYMKKASRLMVNPEEAKSLKAASLGGFFNLITSAYKKYLMSYGGKHYDEKLADDHIRKLQRIVTYYVKGQAFFSPKIFRHLKDIDESDRSWIYAAQHEDHLPLNTVYNYLVSLNIWYDFLQSSPRWYAPWETDIAPYITSLQRAMSNLKRQPFMHLSVEEKAKKLQVPLEHLQEYYRSTFYQQWLTKCVEEPDEEKLDYIGIRNFLLFALNRMCIGNSDDLASLTMGDYERRVRVQNTVQIKILPGTSCLVVDLEMSRCLEAFVGYFRTQVMTNEDEMHVFLTRGGIAMDASMQNKCISKHWHEYRASAPMPSPTTTSNKLCRAAVTWGLKRGLAKMRSSYPVGR